MWRWWSAGNVAGVVVRRTLRRRGGGALEPFTGVVVKKVGEELKMIYGFESDV